MRIDDLLISIAYFSIPVQIVVSLYQYPRLASMPLQILVLFILFALFIFCCGAGHWMRCMGKNETFAFSVMNSFTAFISVATALYLLPLVPSLMSDLDSSLQKLVKLNEETAESKRKLFTFMAFLCHEIRNPLFAITTNVEFAKDMEMSQELGNALTSIDQSTTLMLRLVNDVLDLSKIESGKLELDEHEFDAREFFQNVAASMSGQVNQKKNERVEFIFNMADNVPRIVICDSVRLLQIAYNLLSNAAKFTELGSITFSVSVCELREAMQNGLIRKPALEEEEEMDASQDEKADSFCLSLLQAAEEGHALANVQIDRHVNDVKVLTMMIEDTGSGIPEDRIERIFQPYTQSKLSDFRKHGGTGLGLSIISKLAEIMGGTVKVKSTEGKGSTFMIHLPIIIPKNPTRETLGTDVFEALNNPTSKSQTRGSLAAHPSVKEASNTVESRFKLAIPCSPDDSAPLQTKSTTPSAPVSGTLFHPPPVALPQLMSNSNATSTVPLFATTAATPAAKTNDTNLAKPNTNKVPLSKFCFPTKTNVVLVVDDNVVNRKLIGKMLSFFNIEYDQAENGQEAVDIMLKSRNLTGNPDAPLFGMVIMDLCMPVMDGYEATRALRDQGLSLPIIALTANALSEGKLKALDAGATEFATKPILRHVLHAFCAQYLKHPETILQYSNGSTALDGIRYCGDEDHGIFAGESELVSLT